MDGSMPVLDGFAAARAIREREAATGRPRTPIIALTAHVLGEAAETAEAAGMDGMLLKPFTLKQLAALLERHTPAHREAAPAPVEPAGQDRPEVEAPDHGALLDGEVLDGLLGLGDGAFLDRILDLYRRQAPLALSALRSALAASDQPGIAKAAHSLKSMSANIGARALAERLGTIEQEARNTAYAGSPAECDALETLLGATMRGLEARTQVRRTAA
jgi:two-component system sensor histidine kinase BarA